MVSNVYDLEDHELIGNLNSKVRGDLEDESHINEVNMCTTEPPEIPGLAKIRSTHTWLVYARVKRRKGTCKQVNRSSKTGSWKITGNNAMVKDFDGNIVGYKIYLTFKEKQEKKSPSSSSSVQQNTSNYNWTMQEYHTNLQHENTDNFVLCKIAKKKRRSKAVKKTESPSTELRSTDATPGPDHNINVTPNDNILGDEWEHFDFVNYFPYPQVPDLESVLEFNPRP